MGVKAPYKMVSSFPWLQPPPKLPASAEACFNRRVHLPARDVRLALVIDMFLIRI